MTESIAIDLWRTILLQSKVRTKIRLMQCSLRLNANLDIDDLDEFDREINLKIPFRIIQKYQKTKRTTWLNGLTKENRPNIRHLTFDDHLIGYNHREVHEKISDLPILSLTYNGNTCYQNMGIILFTSKSLKKLHFVNNDAFCCNNNRRDQNKKNETIEILYFQNSSIPKGNLNIYTNLKILFIGIIKENGIIDISNHPQLEIICTLISISTLQYCPKLKLLITREYENDKTQNIQTFKRAIDKTIEFKKIFSKFHMVNKLSAYTEEDILLDGKVPKKYWDKITPMFNL